MKTLEITRLELVGFGKFRERTIDLTSGLNLIEGPNEACLLYTSDAADD